MCMRWGFTACAWLSGVTFDFAVEAVADGFAQIFSELPLFFVRQPLQVLRGLFLIANTKKAKQGTV